MKRKFIFSIRGISLVLVTLIFYSISTSVSAVPPGACHPWPQCKDEGGGDPPEPPTTEAGWNDAFILEGLRDCWLGSMNPDGTTGHYKCDLSPSSGINFSLPAPDFESYKGGYAGLCEEFGARVMTPNTNYAYAWGDKPCVSGSCEIHVLHWFYGYDVHGIEGIGLINLDAYGMTANDFESNPFAVSQVVSIFEVNLTLRPEGKNRTIATCKWDAKIDGASFISNPDVDE